MLIQNFNFFIIKTNSISIENLSFGGVGGGGKTYALTQFLIYKAVTEQCRILCLREFSNSQKASLINEFKALILEQDLEAHFKERLD